MGDLCKLPPAETVVLTCIREGSPRFVITSKLLGGGTIYTLYELCGTQYRRLGKAPSPLTLESNFHIWDE